MMMMMMMMMMVFQLGVVIVWFFAPDIDNGSSVILTHIIMHKVTQGLKGTRERILNKSSAIVLHLCSSHFPSR